MFSQVFSQLSLQVGHGHVGLAALQRALDGGGGPGMASRAWVMDGETRKESWMVKFIVKLTYPYTYPILEFNYNYHQLDLSKVMVGLWIVHPPKVTHGS
jgi:hypothetical protein